MSAEHPGVVALWCADDSDPGARGEVLRVLVAVRAAGRPLRLLDLRPDPAPGDPALSDRDQRLLDALNADGVAFERPAPPLLRAALRDAGSVVRLAAARRSFSPVALTIDEVWLAQVPDDELVASLSGCGLLVRAAPSASPHP